MKSELDCVATGSGSPPQKKNLAARKHNFDEISGNFTTNCEYIWSTNGEKHNMI